MPTPDGGFTDEPEAAVRVALSGPSRIRISPFGDLIAVSAKGAFMGNRGCLHDDRGTILRDSGPYRGWVCCSLSFKGRSRKPLRRPGHYTELFLLDEATALSAGHRPCAECRRVRYRAFLGAIAASRGMEMPPRAKEIDAALHAERLPTGARRRLAPTSLMDVPSGAMVVCPARPTEALLWWQGATHCWTPAGYVAAASPPSQVLLLTPPTAVAALRGGYVPEVHASADMPLPRD